MKRNLLLVTVMALASLLAFDFSNSRAQTNAPPSTIPAPATPPGPGAPPMLRGRRPMTPGAMAFQRAVSSLRLAKLQLERAEGDFGGHKQSAIDACAKAMDELQAVIAASPVPPAQPAPPGQPAPPVQPAPPAQPAPPPQ